MFHCMLVATLNKLLELFNNFIKVPGESQNVRMLLLRELGVDAESGIHRGKVNLGVLLLLYNGSV